MKPRKLLSLFLAVLMVVSLLPVSALAEEIPQNTAVTLTELSVPTGNQALPAAVTAAANGYTLDVGTITWLPNDSTAKYGTTYTAVFNVTSSGNTFASSYDKDDVTPPDGYTVQSVEVVKGTADNDTLRITLTCTTPKAGAPTVAAGTTPIDVPNTGVQAASYSFDVSGLLDGTEYADGGITYAVTKTDTSGILTVPADTKDLVNGSNTITYSVAANAAGEPAKTATFQIEFCAKDSSYDYQTLPADIQVTVNLAAGDTVPAPVEVNSAAVTLPDLTPGAAFPGKDTVTVTSQSGATVEVSSFVIENAAGTVQYDTAYTAKIGMKLNDGFTFANPVNVASQNAKWSVTGVDRKGDKEIEVQMSFTTPKAPVTAIPVPEVKNPVYNGTAQAPSVAASEKYTVSVTPQTDVGKNGYQLTLSLKDKAADVWDLGNGKTTTDDQVLTWNIEPKPVKVYGVSADDKVYDASTSVRITGGELDVDADGNEAYAVVKGDDVELRGTFRRAYTNDANAGRDKAVIVSGYALAGADAGNYRLLQPEDVRVTIRRATPVVTLSNYTAAYTGLPVVMPRATVSGVPGGTQPSGYISYTYYTDSACSKLTTAADGAAYVGGAPSMPGTYYVTAHIGAEGNYTSAYAYAAVMKIVTDFYVNYDITATANRGGSISPSGTVKVASGGDKTFTFRPKDGYELTDVLVDGESIGVVDSYTFRNVKADHSIKAIFTMEDEEPAPPAWKNPFYDVSRGDWFYDAVEYAVMNGIMEGTSGTSFAPAAVTTRGELVTILWRLEGQPSANRDAGFTDLAQNWYVEAVNWAAENDIVKGVGTARFAPDDIVTREQIVTILYRYAAYKGYDTSDYSSFNKFVDGADVSGFAEDAMHWAVSENYIIGRDGKRLDPQGAASRAEVASIFQRFMIKTEE